MADTGFVVTDRTRLAAPYGEGVPPDLMGETYVIKGERGRGTRYAPGRCFDEASFHSGGAGMVGTAPDMMRLLEAFRSGGGPILKPETMAEAARNQIGALPREEKDAGWRFGLLSAVLDDPAAAKAPMAPGTLDWGGVYGLRWMVDLRNGISIATFTNTAVEGCFGDFPRAVRRAAYG